MVRYDASGKFDVKLTVSDGTKTRTILKQKYIQVDHCSGTDEPPAVSNLFTVFPNPSTGQVTIEVNRDVTGRCNLMLFDLAGCRLMESMQLIPAGNRLGLDLSGLGKGLYFLRLQAGELNAIRKVIKN